MYNKKSAVILATLLLLVTFAGISFSQQSIDIGETGQQGDPLYGHTDPSKFRTANNAHGGAGTFTYMEILGSEVFKTNFLFVHSGEIPPKSGIGEHIHREMEEMYFAFDGTAEFTINGETSLLPAGSMVLCQAGDSHGIYNPTDKPIKWLNVAVGMEPDKYDAINYDAALDDQELESPAPFKWTFLDPSLLHPAPHAHAGADTILFRRMWDSGDFKTPWYFVDHCILPPGSSIGYHQHIRIEEIYYLVSGNGLMTVNDRTWEVGPGDAIPCVRNDSHGLYNNSDEPICLVVFSCDSMEEGLPGAKNWGDDLSGRTPTGDVIMYEDPR
jgi:mannose-6-phosphate isomerase-like protein (cupin superfamily)